MSAQPIDVYNPDNYVAGIPHQQFQWLRDNAPVYWHQRPDGSGYWVVSRHAEVVQVSRDHQTFSSQQQFVLVDNLPEDILRQAQGQLLGMDPPLHAKLRRPVITRFTSRMLEGLEPQVRQLAIAAVDKAISLGECDFVFDVAGDLPTAVIGTVMGVPQSQWLQLRHWSDLQTASSDPDLGGSPEQIQQASLEMGMYGYQLATERLAEPTGDLISELINVKVDGHSLSPEEFASMFVQITVAGNETTRGLIAGGMQQLMAMPELYRQLEQNPEQLPLAIEEMLRWTCPLHYFRRTATVDTVLAGQPIAAGDAVVMLYSSANFDERVFDQPMRFAIDRQPNPHLAFGYGIHLCLGANLARLEARLFFEEWFKRVARIELIGQPRRVRSNMVNGLKYLPVSVQPR